MSPEAEKEVGKVLNSGYITQGKKVEEFEEALKEWFGYKYILTVNSATSGLTLALRLCDLNNYEDYIVSTPLTCFATNAAILANNINIKWVDVNENTCNIDSKDLLYKAYQHKRSKVVMGVHWGGNPMNLDEIRKSMPENSMIIEDCAHAFGAEFKGKKLGAHCKEYNSICVFSLQAIKHLTTADGGLIFLPNKELYNRAKKLRWYGIDREQRSGNGDFRMEPDITEWGYKFHMNDVNATIGLCNLPYMNENLKKIRENVLFYDTHLSKLKNVELMENTPYTITAGWIYTIKIIGKPYFIQYMKENGVMVSQVHNRNDKNSCVSKFKDKLPNLDKLEKKIVCIPCGWWLTDNDKKKIVNLIASWVEIFKPRIICEDDYYKGIFQLVKEFNGMTIETPFEDFNDKLQEISKQNSVIMVIENNHNELIAMGKIFIEKKLYESVGHIEDIIVTKSYRDMGFGKLIINKLLKQCKSCYKVVLECNSDMTRFYTNLGFQSKGSQMVRYIR